MQDDALNAYVVPSNTLSLYNTKGTLFTLRDRKIWNDFENLIVARDFKLPFLLLQAVEGCVVCVFFFSSFNNNLVRQNRRRRYRHQVPRVSIPSSRLRRRPHPLPDLARDPQSREGQRARSLDSVPCQQLCLGSLHRVLSRRGSGVPRRHAPSVPRRNHPKLREEPHRGGEEDQVAGQDERQRRHPDQDLAQPAVPVVV